MKEKAWNCWTLSVDDIMFILVKKFEKTMLSEKQLENIALNVKKSINFALDDQWEKIIEEAIRKEFKGD